MKRLKELDEVLTNFCEKIRPYVIRLVQDEEINEYKNRYVLQKEKEPSKKEINEFINLLIQRGEVIDQTDNLLYDFKDEVKQKFKFRNILSTIGNMAIMVLITEFSIYYVLDYFDLIKENTYFSTGNLINAIILIIIAIIGFSKVIKVN